MGFSSAEAGKFYLPVDSAKDAPNIEDQEKDQNSLLNTVKALLRLRNAEEELRAQPNLEILHTPQTDKSNGRYLVYKRGSFIIAVNPGGDAANIQFSVTGNPKLIYSIGGCGVNNGLCKMEPQSFGAWKI